MNNIQLRNTLPAMWGGLECTINRVQNQYYDQFERTGQYRQPDNLQKICDLNITMFRLPVLWERHHDNPDAWKYTAAQLEILKDNGVEPIAGLLHHGSGPDYTNLADPDFPELFAVYAERVAAAFPFINYYTPINEPLTTARFSGLYGLWYPHAKDEKIFATIFLNQLKATVLAMQAIRRINPTARLIQTEDLCKVHCTPSLQYQADFENQRRWWTYDFLTGKVTALHPAWDYLVALGIPVKELVFFTKNILPPAVAGFNYYATSERYLDAGTDKYPAHLIGGNGLDKYADIEATRSGHVTGLTALLTEAWDRYHIPMALTECHLDCTREQQLRWLKEQWEIAGRLNKKNIPVIGVTAWSLAGAYDWNNLVTQKTDHYESGAFALKNGRMVPTALAHMIRNLSTGHQYDHPALAGAGWWKVREKPEGRSRPLVIIDDTMLHEHCMRRYLDAVKTSDIATLRQVITSVHAWAVIAKEVDPFIRDICVEMGVPFVCVTDENRINEALDQLIDEHMPDGYAPGKLTAEQPLRSFEPAGEMEE